MKWSHLHTLRSCLFWLFNHSPFPLFPRKKKSLKTTVMVKEEYQILYVLRGALWWLLSSFSLPSFRASNVTVFDTLPRLQIIFSPVRGCVYDHTNVKLFVWSYANLDGVLFISFHWNIRKQGKFINYCAIVNKW